MIAFCRNGNTLLKYVSVYHCFKRFAIGAQGGKEGGEVLVQEKHSSVHVYYAQVYKAIKYFFLFFHRMTASVLFSWNLLIPIPCI